VVCKSFDWSFWGLWGGRCCRRWGRGLHRGCQLRRCQPLPIPRCRRDLGHLSHGSDLCHIGAELGDLETPVPREPPCIGVGRSSAAISLGYRPATGTSRVALLISAEVVRRQASRNEVVGPRADGAAAAPTSFTAGSTRRNHTRASPYPRWSEYIRPERPSSRGRQTCGGARFAAA
jgi:hypothetical protein